MAKSKAGRASKACKGKKGRSFHACRKKYFRDHRTKPKKRKSRKK